MEDFNAQLHEEFCNIVSEATRKIHKIAGLKSNNLFVNPEFPASLLNSLKQHENRYNSNRHIYTERNNHTAELEGLCSKIDSYYSIAKGMKDVENRHKEIPTTINYEGETHSVH